MPDEPTRPTWEPLTIAEVGSLFTGRPARWWLSGGWAIDHWLGRTTRAHHDIDVSTLRPDLPVLLEALPPRMRPYAPTSQRLLPIAEGIQDPGLHNFWVHDRHRDRWVLQINVEEGDAVRWRYRRDPGVTLPWDRAVVPVRSLPTGTPATQLLWKSRNPRPRDDHDLDVVHTELRPEDRRWLRAAMATAHPASPWASDPRLADR